MANVDDGVIIKLGVHVVSTFMFLLLIDHLHGRPDEGRRQLCDCTTDDVVGHGVVAYVRGQKPLTLAVRDHVCGEGRGGESHGGAQTAPVAV